MNWSMAESQVHGSFLEGRRNNINTKNYKLLIIIILSIIIMIIDSKKKKKKKKKSDFRT